MQNVPAAVARVFSADVLAALGAIKRPPAHSADHEAESPTKVSFRGN
jgi:hypothetical protein